MRFESTVEPLYKGQVGGGSFIRLEVANIEVCPP